MSQNTITEPTAVKGNGHHVVEEDRFVALARDPNIDTAKLRALWEIQQDVMAAQAERLGKEAYALMHHEMPQIERKGKVDSTTRRGMNIKYSFAPLEDIDEIARPIMAKHGFSLTFRPIEQTKEYVIVEGELIHGPTGWSRVARKQEPIDTEAFMNIQQKGGAAQTYAIRYLTIALLNIVVKGEDNDAGGVKREPGATSAPPREESMANKWAAEREAAYKTHGTDWWKTLINDLAMATNPVDLEALVDLARDNVNALDAFKKKDIGAALMKAREKLAEKRDKQDKSEPDKPDKPPFDFPVRDMQGETDGELFTDAFAWSKEFLEYWTTARGVEDRENLLHHNTDAIEAVMQDRPALLKAISEWQKETKEPDAPLFYGAVKPPMNNGKPQWEAWLKSLHDEIATIETDKDMLAWVGEQRSEMTNAPILLRQKAIGLIAFFLNGRGMEKPEWLSAMILPVKAAANHKEWAEARMAELYWIDSMTDFTVAVNAARPRMIVMRQEDKEAFDRVAQAFSEKQAALS